MPKVGQVLPVFANELVALLENSKHPELAATIRDLPLVDRCRCGHSNCAHFYTAPRPSGTYGPGHFNLLLDATRGLVVVDVVDLAVVGVEVLDRPDVTVLLNGVLPLDSSALVDFDEFAICLLDGWLDITPDLPSDSPQTLAKPDGVGALQFTIARWVDGPRPAPTMNDLADMLNEFAEAHQLREARDNVVEKGPPTLAAATFTQDDFVLRAWYLFSEGSFAKITFTAEATLPIDELRDCEHMVRTLTFASAG